MNGDQVAKAAKDSQVIQSQRDTNIGFSAGDMKEIIETLADQVPKFAAIASEIVEARLRTFEEKIMNRFEETTTTRSEAFADPDFQFLLGRSQQAYARSGDDDTAEILVDLIAQRSMQTSRTRLTLSLNDAVEKSAYLTSNEFAELSLCFLMRYTMQNGLTNFPSLCMHLQQKAGPLVSEISKEDSSYSYLSAQSCASVEIGSVDFMHIITMNYGGLVSIGAERQRYAELLGDDFEEKFPNLLRPSIHDQTKLQANAANKDGFLQNLSAYGLEDKLESLWQVHSSGFFTADKFVEVALPIFPEIALLIKAWQDTPIKSLTLTSVGIAIGYANLKRVCGFEADLAIWIK